MISKTVLEMFFSLFLSGTLRDCGVCGWGV